MGKKSHVADNHVPNGTVKTFPTANDQDPWVQIEMWPPISKGKELPIHHMKFDDEKTAENVRRAVSYASRSARITILYDLMDWLNENGHEAEASQLGVYISCGGCDTLDRFNLSKALKTDIAETFFPDYV